MLVFYLNLAYLRLYIYLLFILTTYSVLLDQVPQGLDHPQGHLLFQDQDLGLIQGV